MSTSLTADYTKLTWQERKALREAYVAKQGGKCSHCKQLLTSQPSLKVLAKSINGKLFPTNFFKYPVHLHHDHKTGMTIGAVHNICNAYLWQYLGE